MKNTARRIAGIKLLLVIALAIIAGSSVIMINQVAATARPQQNDGQSNSEPCPSGQSSSVTSPGLPSSANPQCVLISPKDKMPGH